MEPKNQFQGMNSASLYVAWQAGTITLFLLGSYFLAPSSVRGCGLAYPYDWRGFVGGKMKTSVGPLYLIPLSFLDLYVVYILMRKNMFVPKTL